MGADLMYRKSRSVETSRRESVRAIIVGSVIPGRRRGVGHEG